MEVIVKGKASIYPATGAFQLYCDEIKLEGQGDLFIKFEKLKQKLSGMGYFDESHKKRLPNYPNRIGVVTSPTGAAIHDIINVAKRRNDFIDIVLYPAKVQGINAYKDVIKGIEYFNNANSVDVIIVGRGGGSIEELWNFNEEDLAISIYKSKIPIISAVGHEIDFTISDFVSDMRAATPSQGAEIAVPLYKDIIYKIYEASKFLDAAIDNKINNCKDDTKSIERILKLHSPLSKIVNSYLDVDRLKERLNFAIEAKIKSEKQNIEGLNNLLSAYNPIKVISKGYAIIEDEDNKLITSKKQLIGSNKIKISLKDGETTGVFTPLD